MLKSLATRVYSNINHQDIFTSTITTNIQQQSHILHYQMLESQLPIQLILAVAPHLFSWRHICITATSVDPALKAHPRPESYSGQKDAALSARPNYKPIHNNKYQKRKAKESSSPSRNHIYRRITTHCPSPSES